MDLRDLRYFTAIAELKSFTKASIKVRIAQSALSRTVLKLEDELQVKLFERSGRGLEITDAGQMLLQKAYLVLDQFDDIKLSLSSRTSRIAGVATLGVPPAAGEMLVPPVLESVSNTYPNLVVDVVEGFSGNLYESILNHSLSIAIIHNPAPHRELEILPLLAEDMYLVGPAKLSKGLLPPAQIKDLNDIPLILPKHPHSLRVLVETQLLKYGVRLNVVRQVDGLVIIRSMLRAAAGYSILTYGSVHRDVKTGILCAKKIENPPITWNMCLVRRKSDLRRETVTALTEVMLEEVGKLVSNGIWRGNPDSLLNNTDKH